MIIENPLQTKSFDDYESVVPSGQFQAAIRDSKFLKNVQILHLNATPKGGGVAEILKSLVPLQKNLGLQVRWYSLAADPDFFKITKKLHNSLQGSKSVLTSQEKKHYLEINEGIARSIEKVHPDILVLHDPQPLGAVNYLKGLKAISRIHIDLTKPNADSMNFISNFLSHCQKIVFSTAAFVKNQFNRKHVVISAPAIDPLSDKNRELKANKISEILRKIGIAVRGPLILQVSRFDMWKDPRGVVETFLRIKKKYKTAQLVLAGVIEAQDDPEANQLYHKVRTYARGKLEEKKDFHFFRDLAQLKGLPLDLFINALQRNAAVILQKSTREGFALTVTEAMWKVKSVVGGDVGGIRVQIKDGQNGFLVKSPREAAERCLYLLDNPRVAKKMGQEARASVKKNFLITRLLSDELKILNGIQK